MMGNHLHSASILGIDTFFSLVYSHSMNDTLARVDPKLGLQSFAPIRLLASWWRWTEIQPQ